MVTKQTTVHRATETETIHLSSHIRNTKTLHFTFNWSGHIQPDLSPPTLPSLLFRLPSTNSRRHASLHPRPPPLPAGVTRSRRPSLRQTATDGQSRRLARRSAGRFLWRCLSTDSHAVRFWSDGRLGQQARFRTGCRCEDNGDRRAGR